MVLNNTSWKMSNTPCPVTFLDTPDTQSGKVDTASNIERALKSLPPAVQALF